MIALSNWQWDRLLDDAKDSPVTKVDDEDHFCVSLAVTRAF